jgi:hypothetical protein
MTTTSSKMKAEFLEDCYFTSEDWSETYELDQKYNIICYKTLVEFLDEKFDDVKSEFFDDINEQHVCVNDWYGVLTSEQKFENDVIDNLASACDRLLKYKISLMFDDYVAEIKCELNHWKKD